MTHPVYVAARRTLLDALVALDEHLNALVLVGAQAIYFRTGETETGVSPYTTDADLAVNPSELAAEPRLEIVMVEHGFTLAGAGREERPGAWVKQVEVENKGLSIPVDLMVPEALAPRSGRRTAEIPPHDRMSFRRVRGLEATLYDNTRELIRSFAFRR